MPRARIRSSSDRLASTSIALYRRFSQMPPLRTPTPRDVPTDIVELCRRLRNAGFEAFVVGGAVRDLLLGRPAQDFDVATSATPPEVMRVFGRWRTIPTGEKHGTVTVLLGRGGRAREAGPPSSDEHVEVTTYRGEGAYSDGRRPD